jgi:catechol 2,3-dioxygenase-like lactoylglutathione lyase family enzyme
MSLRTQPIPAMLALLVSLAILGAVAQSTAKTKETAQVATKLEPLLPVLRNTCLITKDVPRLVDFYSHVLRIPANATGNDYAEFRTAGVLAIFSADAQEKYIPGSTQAGSNKSIILEFEVKDVDQEYARLQKIVKDWVKPPTTQPWGTRSIYFRDPDGNLIDFYAWIKSH